MHGFKWKQLRGFHYFKFSGSDNIANYVMFAVCRPGLADLQKWPGWILQMTSWAQTLQFPEQAAPLPCCKVDAMNRLVEGEHMEADRGRRMGLLQSDEEKQIQHIKWLMLMKSLKCNCCLGRGLYGMMKGTARGSARSVAIWKHQMSIHQKSYTIEFYCSNSTWENRYVNTDKTSLIL